MLPSRLTLLTCATLVQSCMANTMVQTSAFATLIAVVSAQGCGWAKTAYNSGGCCTGESPASDLSASSRASVLLANQLGGFETTEYIACKQSLVTAIATMAGGTLPPGAGEYIMLAGNVEFDEITLYCDRNSGAPLGQMGEEKLTWKYVADPMADYNGTMFGMMYPNAGNNGGIRLTLAQTGNLPASKGPLKDMMIPTNIAYESKYIDILKVNATFGSLTFFMAPYEAYTGLQFADRGFASLGAVKIAMLRSTSAMLKSQILMYSAKVAMYNVTASNLTLCEEARMDAMELVTKYGNKLLSLNAFLPMVQEVLNAPDPLAALEANMQLSNMLVISETSNGYDLLLLNNPDIFEEWEGEEMENYGASTAILIGAVNDLPLEASITASGLLAGLTGILSELVTMFTAFDADVGEYLGAHLTPDFLLAQFGLGTDAAAEAWILANVDQVKAQLFYTLGFIYDITEMGSDDDDNY